MIHPQEITVDKEIYVVEEGTVIVLSLSCAGERIERYFLATEIDYNTVELNQISTEMAFRLVRRK